MKFIVTGATSCIGTAVVKYLLQNGHEVICVMREGSSRERLFNEQLKEADKRDLEIVYIDFENYNTLSYQADVFINFAWEGTTREGRNSFELQNKNVENAFNAMKVAARLGCRVYVEAGSQAEYGWQDGNTTEESPCEPFSEYGKAKLRCWQEGKKIAKELNLAYVHLRIFSVYGETESDAAILPYCIKQSLKKEPIELSPCTQNWNFLYRHDAAEMICRLAEKHFETPAKQEVYNIASKDTRTLNDFIEEMAKVISSESEFIFGAMQPNRLLSLSPSITKTLKTIGKMEFTPFADGLKEEFKYLKNYD